MKKVIIGISIFVLLGLTSAAMANLKIAYEPVVHKNNHYQLISDEEDTTDSSQNQDSEQDNYNSTDQQTNDSDPDYE